jgi:polyphenol oxidase
MRPDANDAWLRATGLPARVGGLMSTRLGGVSAAPFDSLNLRPPGLRGDAVDEPAAVFENQRRFTAALQGARPVFLNQVHGTAVVRLSADHLAPDRGHPMADASITTEPGVACTVLVADCLPVLFAAPGGRAVGAAHAGWRGLASGVLEATVAALCEAAQCESSALSAWMGACIGPARFEVGDEVRAAFGPDQASCFLSTGGPGKWWADLPALARARLGALGLNQIAGGRWCTHSDSSRFFSFRRERVTGRMAAAVWIC